jgi:drug/metabolite transporter superfamily protein YnfA
MLWLGIILVVVGVLVAALANSQIGSVVAGVGAVLVIVSLILMLANSGSF